MSVGTDPITVYQGETFQWDFAITDGTGNITDITGYNIEATIKELASDPDPSLIALTCSIVSVSSPMKFRVTGAADLTPGTYVFGARRREPSPSVKWQFVDAALTVVDSPNEDVH